MRNDFSLLGLRERLRELRQAGFRLSSDFSMSGQPGFVFLRHDVDLSLDYAHRVAEFEAEQDVVATFFLQVSGDFYNLLARDSRRKVEEIASFGHKVGLHFDATAGPEESLTRRLNVEVEILEQLIGTKVLFVSQHKPTSYGFVTLVHDYVRDVRDQIAQEFSCVTYCSDSGGFWSHSDYLDRGLRAEQDSLQLLLHPIWWWRDEACHPFERLNDFVNEAEEARLCLTMKNVNRFRDAVTTGSGRHAWPSSAI